MTWTHVLCIGALVAGLAGCGGKKAEMAPGSRLIQSGVWTVCDRGNRLYLSERGLLQLIPMGCLDNQP